MLDVIYKRLEAINRVKRHAALTLKRPESGSVIGDASEQPTVKSSVGDRDKRITRHYNEMIIIIVLVLLLKVMIMLETQPAKRRLTKIATITFYHSLLQQHSTDEKMIVVRTHTRRQACAP